MEDTSPREKILDNVEQSSKKYNPAWNVQIMYSTSKTAHVVKEMGNYKLDILGISECRWTGSGRIRTKSETGVSYTIIYSSQLDTHNRGVALIISKSFVSTLMEWELTIERRLIKACFKDQILKLTSYNATHLLMTLKDEVKGDWYVQLKSVVTKVPQYDMLLIMGDMNVNVGSDNNNNICLKPNIYDMYRLGTYHILVYYKHMC